MTSEGSVYGNARIALAGASDLPHVGLADAAEVLLLLLDSEPARFEQAALRWHGSLLPRGNSKGSRAEPKRPPYGLGRAADAS